MIGSGKRHMGARRGGSQRAQVVEDCDVEFGRPVRLRRVARGVHLVELVSAQHQAGVAARKDDAGRRNWQKDPGFGDRREHAHNSPTGLHWPTCMCQCAARCRGSSRTARTTARSRWRGTWPPGRRGRWCAGRQARGRDVLDVNGGAQRTLQAANHLPQPVALAEQQLSGGLLNPLPHLVVEDEDDEAGHEGVEQPQALLIAPAARTTPALLHNA